EIAGVIEDAYIEARRRFPRDQRQKMPRIVFEHVAVGVNALEYGRGHGKDDAGRIEAPLRQHMVDQVAVNAAVPVLEGMGINETESEDGSGDHRVQVLSGAAVEGDHALDQ